MAPTNLLDLPRELRNRIYSYLVPPPGRLVLYHDRPARLHATHWRPWEPPYQSDIHLLLVCTQLRAEFLPMFYSPVTIIMKISSRDIISEWVAILKGCDSDVLYACGAMEIVFERRILCHHVGSHTGVLGGEVKAVFRRTGSGVAAQTPARPTIRFWGAYRSSISCGGCLHRNSVLEGHMRETFSVAGGVGRGIGKEGIISLLDQIYG